LRQYSFKTSGQANPLIEQLAERDAQLAESANTVRVLQTRLLEQETESEKISTRLAERKEALKMISTQLAENVGTVQGLSTQLAEKDETIQTLKGELTAQRLDAETQLKRITNTLGWRLLSRYGRIKYKYLLPIYRLFGQVSAEPSETPREHSECDIAADKGAGVGLRDGLPRREKDSSLKVLDRL